MTGEESTFQIQLEGLIQLLAQNLYADPDVFLREMIQNAHDSIRRRAELALERGEAELPSARIQVVVDQAAETIEVHDNGSGLTRTEIDEYLSTIGRPQAARATCSGSTARGMWVGSRCGSYSRSSTPVIVSYTR